MSGASCRIVLRASRSTGLFNGNVISTPQMQQNRPAPFAFPCPSSLVSTPRPIASVDSGLGVILPFQRNLRRRERCYGFPKTSTR